MKIKFEVIAPKKGTIEKNIWDATKRGIEKMLKEKTNGMKCQNHGESPSIVIRGKLTNPDIKIFGCCDNFIGEITRVLK